MTNYDPNLLGRFLQSKFTSGVSRTRKTRISPMSSYDSWKLRSPDDELARDPYYQPQEEQTIDSHLDAYEAGAVLAEKLKSGPHPLAGDEAKRLGIPAEYVQSFCIGYLDHIPDASLLSNGD